MNPLHAIRAVCFDWGGTLMSEDGPADVPMALWPEVRVLPGAAECVRMLAGRLPLAVATNATVSDRQMVERALARGGFAGSFAHLFCYRELGRRKGEPGFWNIVAEELGVPPEAIAMIGDSYEQDAELPRRCGVQAVWFDADGGASREGVGVPVATDLRQFAAWVLAAA